MESPLRRATAKEPALPEEADALEKMWGFAVEKGENFVTDC